MAADENSAAQVEKLKRMLQETARAKQLAEQGQKQALQKLQQLKAQMQQAGGEQQTQQLREQLQRTQAELQALQERSAHEIQTLRAQLAQQQEQATQLASGNAELEQQRDLAEVMETLRAARMLETETKQQAVQQQQQAVPRRRLLRYVLALLIAGDLAALYYLRDEPFMAPVMVHVNAGLAWLFETLPWLKM